jgi:hypothetical protein
MQEPVSGHYFNTISRDGNMHLRDLDRARQTVNERMDRKPPGPVLQNIGVHPTKQFGPCDTTASMRKPGSEPAVQWLLDRKIQRQV